MDDDERSRAEIAKLNFLMELLWTEELFSHGRTPDDVEIASDRVLAKWELHLGEAPAPADEYVATRLAEFFVRVRARLDVKVREEQLRQGRAAGPQ